MSSDPNNGTSAGGALRLRTSLLEAVEQYNTAQLASAAASDKNDGEFSSLVKVLVQRAPNVTNPSWAMEECGRLCPSAELWSGSALPLDVWAPPGTPDCPFGTTPADFRVHH